MLARESSVVIRFSALIISSKTCMIRLAMGWVTPLFAGPRHQQETTVYYTTGFYGLMR